MKNIILIAPPAAGKGTQSALLTEYYNIPSISIGALLREEVKDSSDLALEINDCMNNAKLVREEVILDLISKRISKDDCVSGYILDGFPRNKDQAIDYDNKISKIKGPVNYAFYFDISLDKAIERIKGRVNCPNCGSVYNNDFEKYKPKEIGVCDRCGSALEKRSDDVPETFEKRYNFYIESTKPLIEFYKSKGILYTIDSSISKENTFEQMKSILDGDTNEY